MKKEATRQFSADTSSNTRSLTISSCTELRRSAGERLSFAGDPLARHEIPLNRMVPIKWKGISKSLANRIRSLTRRATGFPQRDDVKTEFKTDEPAANGRTPVCVKNWNPNRLRKPASENLFTHAFNCKAALFKSASVESETDPCRDGSVSCEGKIAFPGKAGDCLDTRVFVPTRPLELLRTSEELRQALLQLDSQQLSPPGKTNWEVIVQIYALLKVALAILEASVNEVSNKLESYKFSASRKYGAMSNPGDSNNARLYEDLCKSFEQLSYIASERCIKGLHLVAYHIDESLKTTEYAPTSLRNAALDLLAMYSRIRRVKERLILNKERTIDSARKNLKEEEEGAFDCACILTEAVNRYVISIQSQVLHSALTQQDEVETLKEDESVIESRLQQSWIWQNKLSKLITVLCPNKKQKLFVYLLKRVIEATGELSRYQKFVPVLNDAHCKERLARAASSCQQMLLLSLMQLFERSEAAGLKFRKEGLVAAFDFCKIANASQMYSITLTLLLSAVAEQRGTTTSQSHYFSEALKKYHAELMCFAKPCVEVIGFLASKAAVMTDDINQRAEDVIEAQDNVESELPATVKFSTCSNLILERHRLEREATVHEKINSCINIVRYLGTAVQTDQSGKDQIIGIITEWCDLGDLSKALKEAIWIKELDIDGQDISFMKDRVGYRLYKDWIKRLEVVASIAAGMTYMHDNNIVHRDLTSKNVFLSSVGSRGEFGVKIGDFERGYYLPDGEPIQRTSAPPNSAPFMGLEVLNYQKYGLKADVYSIGTILWQMMYLECPWTHLSRKCCGADEIAIQCLLSLGKISLSISKEDAPDDVPEFPELVRLVKRAWSRDPEDRPTMAEFYTEIVEICSRMK